MITSEKSFAKLWCPHVRAIYIDTVAMKAIDMSPNVSMIGGARPQQPQPVVIQVAGNKGGPQTLPNACMGRVCSQWTWVETVWDFEQRTGEKFDPAMEAKGGRSDRLGTCGLTIGGEAHTRAEQSAMLGNEKRNHGKDVSMLVDEVEGK